MTRGHYTLIHPKIQEPAGCETKALLACVCVCACMTHLNYFIQVFNHHTRKHRPHHTQTELE